jgi:hypothetical protein
VVEAPNNAAHTPCSHTASHSHASPLPPPPHHPSPNWTPQGVEA